MCRSRPALALDAPLSGLAGLTWPGHTKGVWRHGLVHELAERRGVCGAVHLPARGHDRGSVQHVAGGGVRLCAARRRLPRV